MDAFKARMREMRDGVEAFKAELLKTGFTAEKMVAKYDKAVGAFNEKAKREAEELKTTFAAIADNVGAVTGALKAGGTGGQRFGSELGFGGGSSAGMRLVSLQQQQVSILQRIERKVGGGGLR